MYNISLLNCMNSAIGMSIGGVVLAFNIPQNCLGQFFSISGSLNYKSARLVLHYCTNCFSTQLVLHYCTNWIVLSWFFPCARHAQWNACFALRHCMLYHRARCLSHLLGFADALRLLFTSTTPTLVASANKNSSILAARRTLVSL